MRLRVMVVEDDPLHRKLYAAWLESSGHHAIMVPDERDAESVAAEHRPDIALVDIRLPYISGLDVIRSIKRAAAGRHLPIVAVSVLSSREDEEASLAAGATCHFRKPTSIKKLAQVIAGLTARPA